MLNSSVSFYWWYCWLQSMFRQQNKIRKLYKFEDESFETWWPKILETSIVMISLKIGKIFFCEKIMLERKELYKDGKEPMNIRKRPEIFLGTGNQWFLENTELKSGVSMLFNNNLTGKSHLLSRIWTNTAVSLQITHHFQWKQAKRMIFKKIFKNTLLTRTNLSNNLKK